MVLGFWNPNSPFVLFGPEYGLFKLPKHYVLKVFFGGGGEVPILF